MAHPYQHLKEKHAGRKRAHEHLKKYARGGAAHSDEAEDKAMIKKAISAHDKQLHGGKHTDLKAAGLKRGGRLDKFARGGKTKKGHHTHINIMVAPKGGDSASAPMPPPAGPPAGMAPPIAPKPPMGPPMGGPPMGAPGMTPGMKRGGSTSGIANKENIKKWEARTAKNTRYASGGAIPPKGYGKRMEGGADSGEGRLNKIKMYGLKPKKGK